MTRRILQGGEDTWPGDGGTNRGEAFRVLLQTPTGYRATGTYTDAVWKPTSSACYVMISHIVGFMVAGQTFGGSSTSGLSATFALGVNQSSGNNNDFTLWSMSMPTGDWSYKGSSEGYNWVAPADAGGLVLDGTGARANPGTDEGGGAGVYAKNGGLGSNAGGYFFNFPFSGYIYNPIDSISMITTIGNPSGSTGMQVNALFQLYGWVTLL
jgi:hypothetical protein